MIWDKIKDFFKDYKDVIIEDQRETIRRLQKENSQKQNEIFSLMDLVEVLKHKLEVTQAQESVK